jgi:hypothetical protein
LDLFDVSWPRFEAQVGARGFGELGVAIASKVLCLSRAVSKVLRN